MTLEERVAIKRLPRTLEHVIEEQARQKKSTPTSSKHAIIKFQCVNKTFW